MFVWQTHSLVEVIRLTGKSVNRNSDNRRSAVFVNIINSLVWQRSAVGTQNATRPRCYQNNTVN
jgi:hypothetical protein